MQARVKTPFEIRTRAGPSRQGQEQVKSAIPGEKDHDSPTPAAGFVSRFMSRGAAASKSRPLKMLGNSLQHERDMADARGASAAR
jgi:hypothetical protein